MDQADGNREAGKNNSRCEEKRRGDHVIEIRGEHGARQAQLGADPENEYNKGVGVEEGGQPHVLAIIAIPEEELS